MTKNVGGVDKTLRVILGVVLVAVGILSPVGTVARVVLFVVAGIAFLTAFSGF